jgi:hypothetical protein
MDLPNPTIFQRRNAAIIYYMYAQKDDSFVGQIRVQDDIEFMVHCVQCLNNDAVEVETYIYSWMNTGMRCRVQPFSKRIFRGMEDSFSSSYRLTKSTHTITHKRMRGNGEAEYNSKPPNLSPAGILGPASLDLHASDIRTGTVNYTPNINL